MKNSTLSEALSGIGGTVVKINKRQRILVNAMAVECFKNIYKAWHPLAPDDPEVPEVVDAQCRRYSEYMKKTGMVV